MKRLHSLKSGEVSLVPAGANNKRFLVLKEQKETVELPESAPSLVEKIKKVLKSFAKKPDESDGKGPALSREAHTALEATARILAPHKDEITDDHLDAIQEEIGIGGGSHEESEEGEDDVKPEHMKQAKEKAEKAYKEEMEKLGYQKYPEAELAMKSKKKDNEEEEEEEEEEVGKEAKPILKEDGSVNLEAVPTEMRPFVEHITKSMDASKSRAEAAEQRAVKLEKELTDNKAAFRKTQLESIAKGFECLNPEDSLLQLEIADSAGSEKFARVLKILEGQNSQMKESKVFASIGSPMSSSTSTADSFSKVEKAIEGLVQKSAEKGQAITKEQAMNEFYASPEGQRLYAIEKQARQAARHDGA